MECKSLLVDDNNKYYNIMGSIICCTNFKAYMTWLRVENVDYEDQDTRFGLEEINESMNPLQVCDVVAVRNKARKMRPRRLWR